MRKPLLAIILTAGAFCGGCLIVNDHPQHPHGMPPGQAKKIFCSHSSSCNHVCLDDGTWIEISIGHVHTAGCGHIIIGGVWVVEKDGKGKGKGKGH